MYYSVIFNRCYFKISLFLLLIIIDGIRQFFPYLLQEYPIKTNVLLSQMMLSRDERFRKRFADSNNDDSAIASGGDGGGTDDASGSNPSYRFTGPPPVRHRSSPPRLASPSRTCLTDSEILRSPTEVLYAVSDKRRIRNGGDQSDIKSVSASVQTVRSELRQNPPGYYAKNPNRPSRNSSREDLLTDDQSYVSTGRRSVSLQHQQQQQMQQQQQQLQQQQQRRTPSYSGSKFGHHTARSLDRFLDGDDKENAFKTRIQVKKMFHVFLSFCILLSLFGLFFFFLCSVSLIDY